MRVLTLFLIIGCITYANAQTELSGGIPFMTNYDNRDYETSENQHWAVIQNKEGIVFFGNNEGLLEYDGSSWNLIVLPNKSVVRSLAMNSEGTIFVGAKGEFGYLSGSAESGYEYQSLMDSIPEEDREFEDVWRIYVDSEDQVFFQSFVKIFVWNDKQFKTLQSKTRFHLSFFINNTFYVNERGGEGLKILKNGQLEPAPNASVFSDMSVYDLLPYRENELLVATRTKGLFIYDVLSGTIRKNDDWREIDSFLKENQIFSAKKYNDDTYLFGTLTNGLVAIRDGAIVEHVNKQFGLINNTVWGIAIDSRNNIFLALDNGISYVSLDSPFRLYNESLGLLSTVLAVEEFNGDLYVGTSYGLFRQGSKNKFEIVDNAKGYIWHLKTINDHLYASTYSGLLRIDKNQQFTKLLTDEYLWKILPLSSHQGKVLAGTRDGGLLLFEQGENGLKLLAQVSGFNQSARWLVEDNQGRIWVSHYNKGVSVLDLNEQADSVTRIEFFNEKHGLPSNTHNYVFQSKRDEAEHGVLIGTESGVFSLDQKNGVFKPVIGFNELGDKEGFLTQYVEFGEGKAFVQHGNTLGFMDIGTSEQYQLNTKPFQPIANQFCDIIKPITSSNIYFGTSKGLYYFHQNKQTVEGDNFPIVFRQLLTGDLKHSSTSPNTVRVDYQNNSLMADYAWPYYQDVGKVQYSYQLVGFDQKWSEWGNSRHKEYTNLTEGNYNFEVKAKNVYGDVSEVASFSFTIAPPYYRKSIAYLAYIICAALSVWGIVALNVRRHKREKIHLQAIVGERTQEILSQKDELKVQNEQLVELHREKDGTMGIVAHDLRAPFGRIKGLIKLITMAGQVVPEQLDYIDKINASIAQGNQLISDLLDVNSFQQDNLRLNVEKVNITELFIELKEHCNQSIEKKQQHLIIKSDLPEVSIHTDRMLLWRLLENLLSNASKYSPPGKSIVISAGQADENFIFSIKDEGPGFTAEDKGKMFSKFQKLSARPTGDESSTGLGLSIVKIIVDRLQGNIELHSELKKGSEFVITLSDLKISDTTNP